jgi:hypothetical protein
MSANSRIIGRILRRRSTVRPSHYLAAVCLATLAAMVLASAPAHAYTISRSQGRPGRVIAYKIQGSHFNSCGSLTAPCYTPWVVGTGPVVHRSRATRKRQFISVFYRLRVWNGTRWVIHGTRNHFAWLRRGHRRIQMPRPDFLPNTSGSFRFGMTVVWQRPTGRVIGARVFTYNRAGDYVCNTAFTQHCSATGGWVYLRSPGLLRHAVTDDTKAPESSEVSD